MDSEPVGIFLKANKSGDSEKKNLPHQESDRISRFQTNLLGFPLDYFIQTKILYLQVPETFSPYFLPFPAPKLAFLILAAEAR